MNRPEGTEHTCPAGYYLVEQSIDPATPPTLEDGQVLLIKAGPNHYLGINTSGRDVSHYDVCQGDGPPVTVPPVTSEAPPVTSEAPPVTSEDPIAEVAVPRPLPELAVTGLEGAGAMALLGLGAVLVGVALAWATHKISGEDSP